MNIPSIKFLLLFLFLIIPIFLSGCADVEYINSCLMWHEYWFFGGLWHWIIIPFSFIGSLFSDSIAIYAVNNSWWRYDFWFILGLSMWGAWGWYATNQNI